MPPKEDPEQQWSFGFFADVRRQRQTAPRRVSDGRRAVFRIVIRGSLVNFDRVEAGATCDSDRNGDPGKAANGALRRLRISFPAYRSPRFNASNSIDYRPSDQKQPSQVAILPTREARSVWRLRARF
jgi:hypothetical protein